MRKAKRGVTGWGWRLVITATVSAGLGALGGCDQKPAGPAKVKVGFAQVGAESDWRRANTVSIQAEAAARGIDLRLVDAQQRQENQIKLVRSFIAQKVDVIGLAPVVESGWEPVLKEARAAGIPVILTDRTVDVADQDLFVTFIGADFREEGRRAAHWLASATGGTAKIAELQGTPGASAAKGRKEGFEGALGEFRGMSIVKSQSGEFTRAKGREVMETFLKSPEGKEITAVFAHNDDMALGAIQAIEEAGLKPGVDIRIVSIDGVRAAFEAMAAGKLNCTVECTPLLGPYLFDTVEAVLAGRPVEKRIVTEARVFEQGTAAEDLKSRQY